MFYGWRTLCDEIEKAAVIASSSMEPMLAMGGDSGVVRASHWRAS